jgi:hypothetical protein
MKQVSSNLGTLGDNSCWVLIWADVADIQNRNEWIVCSISGLQGSLLHQPQPVHKHVAFLLPPCILSFSLGDPRTRQGITIRSTIWNLYFSWYQSRNLGSKKPAKFISSGIQTFNQWHLLCQGCKNKTTLKALSLCFGLWRNSSASAGDQNVKN